MKKFALKSTVIAMSLCGYSATSFAEDEQNKDKIEKVTITGTRIINALPTERLVVIDAETIAQSGVSSVNSLLQILPSNTNSGTVSSGLSNGGEKTGSNIEFNDNAASSPNLRGLGANATLVLINGRRPATSASGRGASTDIGSIPVDAIERIEIFSGGASAIYGADAVGGVINIIMKKDYSGTSVALRHGNSASDADDFSASLQSGIDWDTGNAIVSVRYEEQQAVETSEFRFKNNDFRAFGGNNYEAASPFGHFLSLGFDNPEIMAGQRPEGLSGELTAADLLTGDNVVFGDSRALNLAPEIENYSVFTSVTQELGDFADLTIDGRFSHRETSFIGAIPTANFFYFPGDAGNPFNDYTSYDYQFLREVSAGLINRDSSSSETEQFDIGASINGHFEVLDGQEWNWTATLGYGKEESDAKFSAIDSSELRDFGQLDVTKDNFLDDQSIAYLQSITTDNLKSARQNDTSDNMSFEFSMTGSLLELPAGDLGLAIGAEYRNQGFEKPDADVTARDIRFVDAERAVTSVFAEFNIPVVSRDNKIPGIAELTVSAAVRHESYDDTITSIQDDVVDGEFISSAENVELERSATSPKIGISWRPINDLRFTFNWGESFLAPSLTSIAFPLSSRTRQTFDPNAPGGPRAVIARHTIGGNLNADNEDADTLSMGINYRPAYLDGFEFGVDYYKIDYKNRITSTPSTFFFQHEDVYQEFITRDENGVLTDLYTPFFLNARKETIRGLDISTSYSTEFNGGQLKFSLDINHVIEDVRQIDEEIEPENIEGTIDGPIEWSGRTQVSWVGEQWSFTGAVNYKDGYSIASLAFDEALAIDEVKSSSTVDLQVSYDMQSDHSLLKNTKINFGATNIFDKEPPFANMVNGLSSYTYDIRRRVVYLELNKSF